MHKCLQLADLQALIFGYLEGSEKTLASLASTCKAFTGPATDLLWKKKRLYLVMKTIGLSGDNSERHSEPSDYILPEDISPERFTRLRFYARKSRSLLVGNSPVELDSFTSAIHRLRLDSIFPQIRRADLNFFSNRLSFAFLNSCILTSTLVELNVLSVPRENSIDFIKNLPNITSLTSLRTLALQIDDACYGNAHTCSFCGLHISKTIQSVVAARNLPALENIRLRVIRGHSSLITDLLTIESSQAPIKLDLKASMDTAGAFDLDQSLNDTGQTKTGFGTVLSHRDIEFCYPMDTPRLISYLGITTESLTLLNILLQGDTNTHLSEIFWSISRLSSLGILRIGNFNTYLNISSQDFADLSKVFMGQLFSLHQIQCFENANPFVLGIDDAWLANAALSWKGLTKLTLTYGDHDIPPQMTLEGVIPLLNSCPLLHELSVSLICQSFDLCRLSLTARNNQVFKVNFDCSIIKYPWEEVFPCLEAMFPVAREIKGNQFGTYMWMLDIDRAWLPLNERLKKLLRERGQ